MMCFRYFFKNLSLNLSLICIISFSQLWGQTVNESEVERKLDLIDGPILTAEISKNELSVGEKITLTVTLTQVKDDSTDLYTLPLLTENIGDFLIKDYQIIKVTQNTEELNIQQVDYQITSYKVGKSLIPSFTFKFSSNTVSTPSMAVEVISTIDENDPSLTMEEVVTMPSIEGEINKNLYIAFGILSLMGLIAGGFWFFRSRRKSPPIPFYILVENQFTVLQKILPIKQDLKIAKKFYYRFYELAKFFLSEKEKQPKMVSLTTVQFNRLYKNKGLESFDFYCDFFEYADKIKFTDTLPDEEITKKQFNKFKQLVRAYREQMEAELAVKEKLEVENKKNKK